MNQHPVETKARILVVQDDPVLLGLVSGSLRPEGHQIIEIGNPKEALSLSVTEFKTIDLAVVAVSSRPISGIEFAKRLNRRGIDLPILFTSASHSLAGVIAGSLGQSSVIEEPFTGAELRSAVKKILLSHRRKQVREVA